MEDDVSSVRHHYLPVFYLKGFTDPDGLLFTYDKLTNRISHKGPKGVFKEDHRNTGILVHQETGEIHRSDIAERVLADFDTSMGIALRKVRESKPEDNIIDDKLLLYEIRLLINSIFWRSPINDVKRNELIDNYSFKDLGFGVFDNNKKRHVESEELLKTIDLYRKFYPVLLMISSFKSKYKKLNDNAWGIYYLSNDYHITTDNPVILKEYVDLSSLQEELIFPLSKNMIIVSTKKYKVPRLPLQFSQMVDLLLFHTAGRYVAGSNKGYLEFLAEEVKKIRIKPNWEENLKNDIFNYFY